MPRARAAPDDDRLTQRVEHLAFDASLRLGGGEPADVHPADLDAGDDRVLMATVVRPCPADDHDRESGHDGDGYDMDTAHAQRSEPGSGGPF